MNKKLILALSIATLGSLANAQSQGGGDHNIGWTAISNAGAFTTTAPSTITIGTTDEKEYVLTLLDYDLFVQGELETSRANTHVAYTLSIATSHQGVYFQTMVPPDHENIVSDLGCTMYHWIATENALPGYYIIDFDASDEYTVSAAVDSGVQKTITISVNSGT